MLRHSLLLAMLFWTSIAIADDAGNNTLSKEEAREGFTLLFDGKTMDHWRGYQAKTVPSGWKVIDGCIVRVGGGGDIISKKEYGNFELRLDWKVAPKGNSGIMYHVLEKDGLTSYMTGPEYQVLDNKGHADGRNKLTSAGSCYGLYAPMKEVCNPAGEWNHARIVIKDGHVEHWLNGTKVVEYVKGGDEWNKKLANSKFKQWPEFGKPTHGHLCLQDHGDKVEYRNIRIRELK